jgi:uncharacterized protein (UPF0305 family)
VDDKILTLVVGAVGAMAGGLVNYGMFKQKMRALFSDVEKLKTEQVKRADHDEELLNIHRRIDRHSKESDKRADETQKILREIEKSLTDFQGYIRGRFERITPQGGNHE